MAIHHATHGEFDVTLASPVYEVVERFRNSKAKYAALSIGDTIQFRMKLEIDSGRSGGGSYALEVELWKHPNTPNEQKIWQGSPHDIQKNYRTDDNVNPDLTLLGGDRLLKSEYNPIFRIAEVDA